MEFCTLLTKAGQNEPVNHKISILHVLDRQHSDLFDKDGPPELLPPRSFSDHHLRHHR